MPSATAHTTMSDRAGIACRTILQSALDRCHEWVVITAFYQAVHAVEAFLASQQFHSDSHQTRNDHLRQHWPQIYRPFILLYRESLAARYLNGITPGCTYAARMPPQSVESKVINGWLAQLNEALLTAVRSRHGTP